MCISRFPRSPERPRSITTWTQRLPAPAERRDIDDAVGMLTAPRLMIGQSPPEKDVVRDLVVTREAVTLVFDDRSTLGVPRNFSGRVTDLDVAGARAGDLLRGRRSFAGRRLTSP